MSCTNSQVGSGLGPQGVVGNVVSASERCHQADCCKNMGGTRCCRVESQCCDRAAVRTVWKKVFVGHLRRMSLREADMLNRQVK